MPELLGAIRPPRRSRLIKARRSVRNSRWSVRGDVPAVAPACSTSCVRTILQSAYLGLVAAPPVVTRMSPGPLASMSLHDLLLSQQQVPAEQDVDGFSCADAACSEATLNGLRQAMLDAAMKAETQTQTDTRANATRAHAWKVLLGLSNDGTVELSANAYVQLVKLGPSSVHDKIMNDT